MLGHQRTLIVIALVAEPWRAMPAVSRTALRRPVLLLPPPSKAACSSIRHHYYYCLTRQRAADAAASLDDFAEVDYYDGRA